LVESAVLKTVKWGFEFPHTHHIKTLKGVLMKHPLVVGYKGEIGSFILSGLLRVMPKALNIWCTDVNESDEEVASRIKIADVIFLCVPLQSTLNWLLKFKNLLKDKTIIEQCSLKEGLFENESIKELLYPFYARPVQAVSNA
jgi:hypothetical protein